MIGGSSDGSVYLCDLVADKTVRFAGHEDDVNAVSYICDSGNIFCSGSDDNTVLERERRKESYLTLSYFFLFCFFRFVFGTRGVKVLVLESFLDIALGLPAWIPLVNALFAQTAKIKPSSFGICAL